MAPHDCGTVALQRQVIRHEPRSRRPDHMPSTLLRPSKCSNVALKRQGTGPPDVQRWAQPLNLAANAYLKHVRGLAGTAACGHHGALRKLGSHPHPALGVVRRCRSVRLAGPSHHMLCSCIAPTVE